MLIRALPTLRKLRVVLGSQSPRRRELLERAGLAGCFSVISPQVDESTLADADPRDAVLEIARRKCQKLATDETADAQVIVCADTVVVIDDGHSRRAVSKPEVPEVAKQMLRDLSGREHQVLTAVCIAYRRTTADPFAFDEFIESTSVLFGQLDDDVIDWYVATGEPLDKAGGYGIQGLGCSLVEGIVGDFYNVMGLPVHRLGQHLDEICRTVFADA